MEIEQNVLFKTDQSTGGLYGKWNSFAVKAFFISIEEEQSRGVGENEGKKWQISLGVLYHHVLVGPYGWMPKGKSGWYGRW